MSCAAVKVYTRRIEIACDSCITQGDTIVSSSFKKMTRATLYGHDVILAGTGSIEVIDAFRHFLISFEYEEGNKMFSSIIEFKKKLKEFVDTLDDPSREYGKNNNEYLMVIDGKAYYIHATLIEEVENFRAIGSGMPYALTAMYLEYSPEVAVAIASELDPWVSKPINVYYVDIPEEKSGE